MKKLFLISQEENTMWDTYDSAVVCAKDETQAQKIHPNDLYEIDEEWWNDKKNYTDWTHPQNVCVEYIGLADEKLPIGIVIASFNAS